jgi:hypothetical protein
LDGVIRHYAQRNLSAALSSLSFYTDLEAAYLHRSYTHMSLREATLRGLRTFVFHYFVRGGYRRGEHGFLKAALDGITKFLNYAKLWERIRIESHRGVWTDQDKQLLERFDIHTNQE